MSVAITQKKYTTNQTIAELSDIKLKVQQDLQAVDELITQQLQNKTPLVRTVCEYLISNGGKRIRPLLTLLVADTLGDIKQSHIQLAALIELLHTATLLHDDVVDGSEQRRKKKTAHLIWNAQTSILVGDFLYALSLKMSLITHIPDITATMINMTEKVIAGELMQLAQKQTSASTEAIYLEVIERKTATLFSVASELACKASHQSAQEAACLAGYGLNIGMAYQLIDDVLDLTGTSEVLGKTIGKDLDEGKPTLPLIYAIHDGSKEEAHFIREALMSQEGPREDILTAVLGTVKKTQALERTRNLAKSYKDKAIAALSLLDKACDLTPLYQLADFVIYRQY